MKVKIKIGSLKIGENEWKAGDIVDFPEDELERLRGLWDPLAEPEAASTINAKFTVDTVPADPAPVPVTKFRWNRKPRRAPESQSSGSQL